MHQDCKRSVVLLLAVFSVSFLFHVSSLDVKPQKESYTPDYYVYHNLTSIALSLQRIYRKGGGLIHLFTPKYFSRNNRNQHIIRITNYKSQHNKIKILLSFGEHAREFLPIETLFYFLNKLTDTASSSNIGVDLDKFDIFVIVIANPDGRSYIEKTNNYCWRGTSTGVDINRNFDWEFGGKGSSTDANDEEYRGPHAFSEPELKVYKDLTEEFQFDGFISFHSGTRQIYVPYADTLSKQTGREPENIGEMLLLAKLLSTATVHPYQYGKAANLNDYSADGTVFDYMAGVRKIPFSFAIELWGPEKHNSPSCFDLFNPPNSELHAVTEEIYPLYLKFFQYLEEWKSKRKQTPREPHPAEPVDEFIPVLEKQIAQEVPSLSSTYMLLCFLVVFILLWVLNEKYQFCWRFYQRRRIVSLRALSSSLTLNLFKS